MARFQFLFFCTGIHSTLMWIWRRMEKVSWTEHKTNEEILETIGEERSIIRTIKTRQKKWIGHTLRGVRRITVKNGNRRENARKKIKRKTKTNDAGLDDGGRI